LAVKTASEMTYTVSSRALNSTPTNQEMKGSGKGGKGRGLRGGEAKGKRRGRKRVRGGEVEGRGAA